MDDLNLYSQNEKQIHTLANIVQIFSEDIGMEFGISTCATCVIKRRIISRSEGIKLPNDEVIKNTEFEFSDHELRFQILIEKIVNAKSQKVVIYVIAKTLEHDNSVIPLNFEDVSV